MQYYTPTLAEGVMSQTIEESSDCAEAADGPLARLRDALIPGKRITYGRTISPARLGQIEGDGEWLSEGRPPRRCHHMNASPI